MKTKIFYFSTAGNSLAVARGIANELGDTELISIPAVIENEVDLNASRIGLIFPVYAWGLPGMVVEFLNGLKLQRRQYIFAIATCGGTPGRTLLQLRGILRKAGVDLHAGFVTKEGANAVSEAPGFIKFIESISGKRYGSGKERLEEIYTAIKEKKKHRLETSSLPANFIGGLLYKMSSLAANSLKAIDKNYFVDDKCTMCRTCERICPMANIKVDDSKPVWKHNCGNCYACIQWCPQQAIHIKNETCRYHHPDIKASDLMLR